MVYGQLFQNQDSAGNILVLGVRGVFPQATRTVSDSQEDTERRGILESAHKLGAGEGARLPAYGPRAESTRNCSWRLGGQRQLSLVWAVGLEANMSV